MIQIYNTLTQQKEQLHLIAPPKIGLYVCGLTVYDDCHLGHARLFIWFDTLVRYLLSIGYQVTYVRNITDIDDKIIKRAHELGIDYKELTARVITSMHHDEKSLNILPPSFEPRVTEHIAEIVEMIQILINKGFAYTANNGDVYYSVEKFKTYGELAHQDLNSLCLGARVLPNEEKQNPLDFVLWKAAKTDEPYWPSPWGNGRPGWHIECSTMAKKYLGKNFDIHGGGNDLQFPHHQNEIAQSEAANDSPFANYWMHMGFVQNNQEKMSKSLGNFFTLKEILNRYHPEVLRFLMIASHYRSPVNFSEENLEHAEAALRRFYITLRDLPPEEEMTAPTAADNQFYSAFHATMADDFNTPQALAILFDLAHEVNQLRSTQQLSAANKQCLLLKHLGGTLGLLQETPELFLKSGVDSNRIEKLIISRNQNRQEKNWQAADQIRNQLVAMGVNLEDTKNGTTWLVADRKKYLEYYKNNSNLTTT